MPLYEYQCDVCGHRFEVIHHKMSDAPPEKCPVCGGVIHKMQSAPAIQFKGTGWYVTDYAKKDQSGSKADGGGKDSSKDSGDKAESSDKGGDKSKDSKESKDSKDTTKSTSSDSAPSTPAAPSTPNKTS